MQQSVCYRFEGFEPDEPVQWLSDNGGVYTALETLITAEKLGLAPITTPAYSPQSNGMSEAFVNTLKRDYAEGAMLWDAASVLEQVPLWFEDYNNRVPHSALGMLSPRQYREKCRQLQEQFDSLIET